MERIADIELLSKVDQYLQPLDARHVQIDIKRFIAGNDRFLVMTQNGSLRLLKANRRGLECLSTLELFEDVAADDRDVWSHPALVGNRLYIRNSLAIYCFLLD